MLKRWVCGKQLEKNETLPTAKFTSLLVIKEELSSKKIDTNVLGITCFLDHSSGMDSSGVSKGG